MPPSVNTNIKQNNANALIGLPEIKKNGLDADHMPDLTIQIATRAQWIKHTFEISL
jgi:hypothetical protein